MRVLTVSMILPSNNLFGRTKLNDEEKKYLYDIFLRRVQEKERRINNGKPTKALKLYILGPNGNALDEFHIKPPYYSLSNVKGGEFGFGVIVESPSHQHPWKLTVSLESFEASLEEVRKNKSTRFESC